MLLRSLVVVGLVGLITLAGTAAIADDAKSASPYLAVNGVSLVDPATQDPLASASAHALLLSADEGQPIRFAQFGPASEPIPEANRSYEFAVTAPRGAYGLPVDVSIAQHGSFGFNADGDMARRGSGSEVRFGHGLARHHKSHSSWDQPAFYAFVASDNQALTWAPASSGPGGRSAGFALQDQIRIGDSQAGITYEAGPFQASLAYVQRKVSSTTGATTVYRDENFTGVTFTLRH